MMPIIFPELGIRVAVDPIAFSVLNKPIYWYGIIITCGLILAIILAKKDKQKYGISWDDVTTYLIYAIILGFIGARLYYVVFRWDYYKEHVNEIIKIWHGGIAIYGGIISALITAIVFCKKKKIKFVNLCDFGAPYLALAQSIGRWGNFINQEAYGSATNCIFRMGIYDSTINDYIYVHPTFLYESIANLILFFALLLIKKKQKFEGQLFYLYMIFYGIARAIIEGLRTDSLYIGNLRVSQVLAISFAIIFSILYIVRICKNKNGMSKHVDEKI